MVVTLHGPVDADLLDRTLAVLGDEQADVHLVIDLRDAEWIDVRAVEVLVEASRSRRALGGDLVLSAPRRRVAEALAGRELTIARERRR